MLIAMICASGFLGGPILALVAIGRIRRSRGRLYGMPLAVFTAWCIPLVIINALIVAMLGAIVGPVPHAIVWLTILLLIAADIWYGTDILGERVPGPALVADFQPSLELLAPWREDSNAWIRRTVGVAVHFWAKRSRGERVAEAEALLAFLEPMFEEWEMDAVKGVGWGLKTLGRHYPDLVADWVAQQVVQRQRRHRALMLRKALTYLSDEQRARAT